MSHKDFRVCDGGLPKYHLDAPAEADGKPNVTPVPFTQGLYMFESSFGDQLVSGVIQRGHDDGTTDHQLYVKFTPSDDEYKEAVLTFLECVEMHDGHQDHPGDWGFKDRWGVAVRIPPTSISLNGSQEGNCNIAAAVELPLWDSVTSYSIGDVVTHEGTGANYVAIQDSVNQEPSYTSTHWEHRYNVVVPAADDGWWDIGDDFTIVPYKGGGYWDYDQWDDELVPSATPGYADWMLFDFQQDDVHIVKNRTPSSPLGVWDLDAYKVEPIFARWQFVLGVKRYDVANRGTVEIGGSFTCFRENTT
jgi:hypothetical protein